MREKISLYFKENFHIKGAIVPTIVVTCIFFVNYFFFGMENTIIGPCVTLSYLYFAGTTNHYASMLKTFLIYLVIAALAWVAGMNLALAIIVNAAVFFWIVYGLIDEYHPDNYYTPGMAFILFQLSPVTGFGVVTRLEALVVSFAIIFLALALVPSRRNKETVRQYVENGLLVSNQLITAYENEARDQVKEHQARLRSLNEKICDEIYLYNYASFRKESKLNWYCRFVAMFQVLTVLANDRNVKEKSHIMRNMLNNFSMLFQENQWEYGSTKLQFRNAKPDIHSFRLRFALRMLLIMTPCMIYAFLCPWGNGYWLPVSVYFMLVPLYEKSHHQVEGRIEGTLVGVVLCFVLFSLFPSLQAHIVILTIINFLIYCSTSYTVSVAYITCAVLALSITTDNIVFTLVERLIYTFGGAGLTILASKYIFPIRIKPEEDTLFEKLKELREQMSQFTHEKYPDAETLRHEKDQLLIKSYLLGRRLRKYHEELGKDENDDELMAELNEHMTQMSYYLVHHFVGIKGAVAEEHT